MIIRTQDFLFIKNYRPDRWPSGTPDHEKVSIKGAWLADCDNGPTKTYMVENKDKDAEHRTKYELAFGKRPSLELYDLQKDPGQMKNVAGEKNYAAAVKTLEQQMEAELKATGDPRLVGKGEETFDTPKYLGGAPMFPQARKPKRPTLEAARKLATEAKLQRISAALMSYRVLAGVYPTENQGLKALVQQPKKAPQPRRWQHFFNKLPKDAWDREFLYLYPGKTDPKLPEVVSLGPDGKIGTDDDISSQERGR